MVTQASAGPGSARGLQHGEIVGWLRANRKLLGARVGARVASALADRGGAAAPHEHEGVASCRIEVLCVALASRQVALLRDEVAWAKVRYVARGLDPALVVLEMSALARVLETELGAPRYVTVGPFIEAALSGFTALPTDLPSFVDDANPHAALARDYLDLNFAGDWRAASEMLLDASEHGVALSALYLDVLQVAQRELGRLWQTQRISVADEHYCTAVTRHVIARLQARLLDDPGRAGRPRGSRTLVATAVAGEQHELGTRMVADFFEMAGWRTFFLGADTPVTGLLETIVRRHADLVALSASTVSHVPTVAEFIRAIRSRSETARVPVLVGGHPFEVAPDLWAFVGADASASSAADAVTAGELVVAPRLAGGDRAD